jgi:hypothetical protein
MTQFNLNEIRFSCPVVTFLEMICALQAVGLCQAALLQPGGCAGSTSFHNLEVEAWMRTTGQQREEFKSEFIEA